MTARNRADAFASVGLFERRGRKPVTTHQSRGCHSARPTGRRQNLGGCDQRAAQTEEPQGHGIFHKKLLPLLYCRGWVSSELAKTGDYTQNPCSGHLSLKGCYCLLVRNSSRVAAVFFCQVMNNMLSRLTKNVSRPSMSRSL